MAEVTRFPQKEPPPFETCDWCVGADCMKRRSCALWRDAGDEHSANIEPILSGIQKADTPESSQ